MINGMDGTKNCSRCKVNKSVDSFSGRDNYCRPCRNEYAREYTKRRPDVIKRAKAKYLASLTPDDRVRYNRAQQLGRLGISPEAWDAMFERQGRCCAICRTDVPSGHGWHTDHDHACCPAAGRSCGKCIRAVLCSECNTGLGKFRDKPALLRAAAEYLEQVRE